MGESLEVMVARIDANVENMIWKVDGIQDYAIETSRRVGVLEQFRANVKGATKGVVVTIGSLGTLVGVIFALIKAFG